MSTALAYNQLNILKKIQAVLAKNRYRSIFPRGPDKNKQI